MRGSLDDARGDHTGTRDIGSFDDDTAADFGGDLDDAAMEERESMLAVRSNALSALPPNWSPPTPSELWPQCPWLPHSILTANRCVPPVPLRTDTSVPLGPPNARRRRAEPGRL